MAFVLCAAGGPVHFVLIFMKWMVCSAHGRGPAALCVWCLPLYVLVVCCCVCVLFEGYTSGSRYLCLHSGLLAGLSLKGGNVIQSLYLFSIDGPYVCFLCLLLFSVAMESN